DETAEAASGPKISYFKDIRPLLQAQCQGCHQPSKAEGGYVMTTREGLLKGGESEQAAIVAGKPDESYLIEQITPAEGKAAMPAGKPPLNDNDIKKIAQWITEGAADDTPASVGNVVDAEHPPQYESS